MREILTKSDQKSDDFIELKQQRITSEAVEKFKKATHTTYSSGIPKTFVTLYRRAEFDWLGRLGVDFRNLLHTDQEYDYLEPLEVGDEPVVRTKIADKKDRKSLTMLTLQSDIIVEGRTKVSALTTFMIRKSVPEES